MPDDEPACRFTVPIPPSTNNLFVNRDRLGGRTASPDYKRWLNDAGWILKAQKREIIAAPRGYVRVLVEAPLNRRRDLDNALKPLLDLLVKMSVIADDNLVDDLRIVRAGTGDNVTVSIWPI